jgi:hypothetical protein
MVYEQNGPAGGAVFGAVFGLLAVVCYMVENT